MNIPTPVSFRENATILGIMSVLFVFWCVLMVVLPWSVIIGYVALMASIIASLWMLPRNVDAGVEDNGNFIKVKP